VIANALEDAIGEERSWRHP